MVVGLKVCRGEINELLLQMREIFLDPATGEPWLEGEVYTRPDLADTLDILATAGDRGEENLGKLLGDKLKEFHIQ